MSRSWHVAHPPQKPTLAFDGDCGFCRRWKERWRNMTGTRIDYEPYQKIADQYPEISKDEFGQGVKLIEPDGVVTTSAEAVYRSLSLAGEKRLLYWAYRKLPGFARLSDFGYEFVSRHRGGFLDRLDRWILGKETLRPTYFVTRDLFLRLLGGIYFLAFFQFYLQADGLIGSHGILPLDQFFHPAVETFSMNHVGGNLYWMHPSLFWISTSDAFLHFLCIGGMIAACCVTLSFARPLMLCILWLFYLSLTVGGQIFMSFQWDALLLETGFIAIFLAPWKWLPGISPEWRVSRVALWLLRWLLFRLMFLSGLVKLTWDYKTWGTWQVLKFHYMTQPIPTWTSWYIDQAPTWFHQISLAFMWLAEIISPFFIFAPRKFRVRAFFILMLLQLLIAATGNYGFFNLLTMLLCVTLLDDLHLARRWRRNLSLEALEKSRRWCGWPIWITAPIAAAVILLSITQLREALNGSDQQIHPIKWRPPFSTLLDAAEPLRSVNGYGLFRQMTFVRPELIIEGSNDGIEWKAYTFKWKAGDVDRRPAFCAPLMPRLDWQMWFAALGDWRRPENQWHIRFIVCLLQGKPEVINLLADNPFPEGPPIMIRAQLYKYEFTTFEERSQTGAWWKREYLGYYCPVISRDMIRNIQ